MTRTDSASRHFFPAVVFACFSQVRDCTNNDNRSNEQRVRDAQAVRAWAASRAGDASFADMVHAAVVQAQREMARFAPRAV